MPVEPDKPPATFPAPASAKNSWRKKKTWWPILFGSPLAYRTAALEAGQFFRISAVFLLR